MKYSVFGTVLLTADKVSGFMQTLNVLGKVLGSGVKFGVVIVKVIGLIIV